MEGERPVFSLLQLYMYFFHLRFSSFPPFFFLSLAFCFLFCLSRESTHPSSRTHVLFLSLHATFVGLLSFRCKNTNSDYVCMSFIYLLNTYIDEERDSAPNRTLSYTLYQNIMHQISAFPLRPIAKMRKNKKKNRLLDEDHPRQ